MADSKAMATSLAKQTPALTAPIDRAVTSLLDHIAEDLAREYVRLMEQAAREDGTRRLPEESSQEK